MARHKLAVCERAASWRFFPPQSTCEKHSPVAPDVAQARAKWLGVGDEARGQG